MFRALSKLKKKKNCIIVNAWQFNAFPSNVFYQKSRDIAQRMLWWTKSKSTLAKGFVFFVWAQCGEQVISWSNQYFLSMLLGQLTFSLSWSAYKSL